MSIVFSTVFDDDYAIWLPCLATGHHPKPDIGCAGGFAAACDLLGLAKNVASYTTPIRPLTFRTQVAFGGNITSDALICQLSNFFLTDLGGGNCSETGTAGDFVAI